MPREAFAIFLFQHAEPVDPYIPRCLPDGVYFSMSFLHACNQFLRLVGVERGYAIFYLHQFEDIFLSHFADEGG